MLTEELTLILAKMEVPTDPGVLMQRLVDLSNQRRLLFKQLLTVESIGLTLPVLIPILERLVMMESATINACLAAPSNKWDALSRLSVNKEEDAMAVISLQVLMELHASMTSGIADSVPLPLINGISQ